MGKINKKAKGTVEGGDLLLASNASNGKTENIEVDSLKAYIGSGTNVIQLAVPYSTGDIADDFNLSTVYQHKSNNVVEVFYDDDNDGKLDTYKMKDLVINEVYGLDNTPIETDNFVKLSAGASTDDVNRTTFSANSSDYTHTNFNRKVDSIASLEVLTNIKEGDACETLSYYGDGNGGGNQFVLTAKGSHVVNGGTIIGSILSLFVCLHFEILKCLEF